MSGACGICGAQEWGRGGGCKACQRQRQKAVDNINAAAERTREATRQAERTALRQTSVPTFGPPIDREQLRAEHAAKLKQMFGKQGA
jgi:hypothetical protein